MTKLVTPNLRIVETELDCFADWIEAELTKLPVKVRRSGRRIETSATREQLRGVCLRANVASPAFRVLDVPSYVQIPFELDPRIS